MDKKITIILCALVLIFLVALAITGVFLWQQYTLYTGQPSLVSKGSNRIQPTGLNTLYTGPRFSAEFVNNAGAIIRINYIEVQDSTSGEWCSDVYPIKDTTVPSKYAFIVTGECGDKKPDEGYDLVFNISYTTVGKDNNLTKSEESRVTGKARAEYTGPVPTEDLSRGVNGADHPTTVTGFDKMKPLEGTIYYKGNGTYRIDLENAAGTTIYVTSVSFTTSNGQNCGDIISNGKALTNGYDKIKLGSGEVLIITALCPQKKTGSPYDLYISVNFSATVGGIETTHSEKGKITGGVEF